MTDEPHRRTLHYLLLLLKATARTVTADVLLRATARTVTADEVIAEILARYEPQNEKKEKDDE